MRLLFQGYFMQTVGGNNIYYYSDGIFWVNDGKTDRYFNPNDISMMKDYLSLTKAEFKEVLSTKPI